MIQTINEYLYLAMLLFLILSNIIFMFVGKKNKHNKNSNVNNKLLKLFNEIIPEAIKFAEENNVNGATKKTVALSKIMLECSKFGIDYNNNIEQIDKFIEDLISLTKEVNRVNIIDKVSE